MLFISRRSGTSGICVYDTDDNTEERVEFWELLEMINEYKLEVQLSKYPADGMFVVGSLIPYQVPSETSPAALKLRMMYGIEVTTFRGSITGVRVPWEFSGDVTIRLSDYGNSCEDCIMWGFRSVDDGKVTVILDDKITYSKHTLSEQAEVLSDHSYMYDFRELSDNTALELYNQLYAVDSGRIFRSIIDHKERLALMELSMCWW